jgi:hypothetical protein
VKDIIANASLLLLVAWYLVVYFTIPEAPNGPPRGSRYWLAHKLFAGKRLWVMLIGWIVIGVTIRFLIEALD